MILGIGIDIVDVQDFARRLDRGAVLEAFSERERAYADAFKTRRAQVLAVRWAAKEAFLKAVGTGLSTEWPLNEIEIAHDDGGRPRVELGPMAQSALPKNARIHCSLSHTKMSATACVIIEQD